MTTKTASKTVKTVAKSASKNAGKAKKVSAKVKVQAKKAAPKAPAKKVLAPPAPVTAVKVLPVPAPEKITRAAVIKFGQAAWGNGYQKSFAAKVGICVSRMSGIVKGLRVDRDPETNELLSDGARKFAPISPELQVKFAKAMKSANADIERNAKAAAREAAKIKAKKAAKKAKPATVKVETATETTETTVPETVVVPQAAPVAEQPSA